MANIRKLIKGQSLKKKKFWQIEIHNEKNTQLAFTDEYEFCKGSK